MELTTQAFFPYGNDFHQPVSQEQLTQMQRQLERQRGNEERMLIGGSVVMGALICVVLMLAEFNQSIGAAISWVWLALIGLLALTSRLYLSVLTVRKRNARAVAPAKQFYIRVLNNAQRRHPEVASFLDAVAAQGRLVTHGEYLMLMTHLAKRDRVQSGVDYARQSPYHAPMSPQQIRVLRETSDRLRGERVLFAGGQVSVAGLLSMLMFNYASMQEESLMINMICVQVCAVSFCFFAQQLLGRMATFKEQLEDLAVSDDVGGAESVLFELKKQWPREVREYLEGVAKMQRPLLQDEVDMISEMTQKKSVAVRDN